MTTKQITHEIADPLNLPEPPHLREKRQYPPVFWDSDDDYDEPEPGIPGATLLILFVSLALWAIIAMLGRLI